MQKGLYRHYVVQFIHSVSRLRRVLQFILAGLLLATNVHSQSRSDIKVTLRLDNADIKQSFLALQQKSGIRFSFGEQLVKGQTKKVTADFKETPLLTAVKEVLSGTNLSYRSLEDFIIIEEKPAPKTPSNPNAAAGQGSGAVKGRIVEFETSQPLPGATVRILELNKGTTSDNNGYYRFTGVRAGKYTLQVSFVSYTTENQPIEVREGREETYDVKMQGNNQLGEVVVRATGKTRAPVAHSTEKQVLTEIKNAQSVVSGISSQEISKSADRNAAEVVRRISGVTIRDDKFIVVRGMNERYNLTYLNNNIAPSTELYSRAFSLDLIPTRIIDKILVYKSPAPDLMGDMTGGAVKIFTKDAKTVKHFDIELQTGYRENTTLNNNFLTYQGGKFDFLGVDDGTRKLPSSVPGYGNFNKANISQKTYAETFSPIINYGKQTALPPLQLTANYYNSFRLAGKSLSVLSSFNYKNESQHQDVDRVQFMGMNYRVGNETQNTETSQLSLLQNFSYHLSDSSTLFFKNFLLQQGQNLTILKNGSNNQWPIDDGWKNSGFIDVNTMSVDYRKLRDIILSWSQRFLYSGNVGGTHALGKLGKQNLQWNVGYTYSQLDIPDQRAIHFQQNLFNDIRFLNSGDYEQNWVTAFRSEGTGYNVNLSQGMLSRIWIRNNEKVYNGSADYAWNLKSWVTLKAGTYQQWKERVVFRRAYTLNEGDLNAVGFPYNYSNPRIGFFAPNMDYNIVFWRQQQLGEVWSSDYLRDDNTGLKVFDRTSGSDAYTATEQNNSGYIAASLLPFGGKLDIYGGLRVEYNRQKVAGAISGNSGQANEPVLADLKSTGLFPSLNIGYRPNDDLVLRAGYGRTINRPEFRELSPYSELDYLNNQEIQGNSNLVFATVNNYDLRFEWYPKANEKSEMISLGGFYKEIKNPIERLINRDFVYAGPTLVSFGNAEAAKVYGAEADLRKNLDFVPVSFFRHLSVIANGSYIYSRVDNQRQLQGQSPYSLNAGLYYENAGAGTKAALIFNQIGPRLYAVAYGRPVIISTEQGFIDPGTAGSLIELTRKQLDFSLTQRIVKSLQLKLSVQNLLNSPIQVAEDANFTYKYEKAIVEPRHNNGSITEQVTGDMLSTDYKPGRYFLLTLTYGF